MEGMTMPQPLLQRVNAGFANDRNDRREALKAAAADVEQRFDATLALYLDRVMNVHARRRYHGLLPLHWSRDDFPANSDVPSLSGFVGADYDDDEAPGIAELWAAQFSLKPNPDAVEGTVEYRGQIEGIDVRVWAIANRATFYGVAR
jgi:hypothetical protein